MIEFADFLRARGLMPKDLIPDGKIRRCPTETHPHKRNGAYMWAGEWGFSQDWATDLEPVIWQSGNGDTQVDFAAMRKMQATRQRQIDEGYRKAAIKAADIVKRCGMRDHLYLARKGFPDDIVLVDDDGHLVIPMRDAQHYEHILSIQRIADDGEKRFLFGGRTKGAVFFLGHKSPEVWLCEGYATGLSIAVALKMMHRQASVCVCFSAANLAHVSGLVGGRRLIVADNDSSGTGERFAESTGLAWGMPDEVDTDANDLHQTRGIYALAKFIQEIAGK